MRKISLIVASRSLGTTWPLAQPAPGILQGTVVNAKGKPVASARVFVQRADGTAPRAVKTDAQGHFRTPLLNTGLYDVRAEAAGNWSAWAHNVVLKSGQQPTVTLEARANFAASGPPIAPLRFAPNLVLQPAVPKKLALSAH